MTNETNNATTIQGYTFFTVGGFKRDGRPIDLRTTFADLSEARETADYLYRSSKGRSHPVVYGWPTGRPEDAVEVYNPSV